MTVHGIEADQRTGTAAGENRGRAELATGSEAGVLVLGGSGLLGRALGAAYDAAGIWAFAPPRPVVDATDAAALATMVEALRPAVVVNAAAFTGVDAAEEHREACRAVNAGIAASLADAVAGIEATLIHISTDFVFDGEANRPYHEYDAVAPVNWYGATKEEGERAVRASGCHHVILRTAWLHGSGRGSFVSAFLDRLAAGERVDAVSDRVASPTSVDELADAITALTARLRAGRPVPSGTYHFAGKGGATPRDIALEIAAACRADPRLVNGVSAAGRDEPARRPRYAALDTGLARARLGLEPRPWQDGVRRTVGLLSGGLLSGGNGRRA